MKRSNCAGRIREDFLTSLVQKSERLSVLPGEKRNYLIEQKESPQKMSNFRESETILYQKAT